MSRTVQRPRGHNKISSWIYLMKTKQNLSSGSDVRHPYSKEDGSQIKLKWFVPLPFQTEHVTDGSFKALKEHASFILSCRTNYKRVSVFDSIVWPRILAKRGFKEMLLVFLQKRCVCHNCRETQELGVEFIPQLLTLPPPGTCFILPLEPHLDCTVLKSNFWSRIWTWKNENVSFQMRRGDRNGR